jgi:hypothetical protein
MSPVKFWRNLVSSAAAAAIIASTSCKKIYDPPAISAPASYLVVEGVINSGGDSTFIKLSRTVGLQGKVSASPELHAIVTVEGDQNSSYPLTETGNGIYSCRGLNLDSTHKYRLNIKTTSGKQYASDYEEVLNSPPIDSISFDTKGTALGPGLNIYANTHDPSGKVRYFRWDYQETWIIHPYYESYYVSNGDTVLLRDLTKDNIYTCWQNDTASTIVLGTTARLTHSVINKNTIVTIPSDEEKLGDRYSIIVHQYALSAGAYIFFSTLKKNTEQLGSIFDAQPSQIPGNIHCLSDPSEHVLGYISTGSISAQRIFIHKSQLPFAWTYPQVYDCTPGSGQYDFDFRLGTLCCYYALPYDGTYVNQVDEYINFLKDGGNNNPFIPLKAIQLPGHPPTGYTAATRECSDCTVRGSNKKPPFWQ